MTTKRIVLALGIMMNFTFSVAEIMGSYMQIGPALRDILIIPPNPAYYAGVGMMFVVKKIGVDYTENFGHYHMPSATPGVNG